MSYSLNCVRLNSRFRGICSSWSLELGAWSLELGAWSYRPAGTGQTEVVPSGSMWSWPMARTRSVRSQQLRPANLMLEEPRWFLGSGSEDWDARSRDLDRSARRRFDTGRVASITQPTTTIKNSASRISSMCASFQDGEDPSPSRAIVCARGQLRPCLA